MQGNTNNVHTACAACKHQRKRCDSKCVLAPFFPSTRTRDFQAVHKLYGVSNVQKLMRSIERDSDRRCAADSLVWEASCREKDPVLGCLGEYNKVCDELKRLKNYVVLAGMVKGGSGVNNSWNGARINGGMGNGFGINLQCDAAEKTMIEEREVGSAVVIQAPSHQHHIHHQSQFYRSNHFNLMDSKSMESVL